MTKSNFVDVAPSLSENDLKAVEQEIGLPLPADLRKHYLIFNGGRPEPRRFVVTPAGYEYDVALFLPVRFSSDSDDVLFEDVYRDLVLERGEIPRALIPLAVNGGDDYFCLIIATGEVAFYAMDRSDDPSKATQIVAQSISEFLDSMIAERAFYSRAQ
jgi:cell wall assembly regulator SMI1